MIGKIRQRAESIRHKPAHNFAYFMVVFIFLAMFITACGYISKKYISKAEADKDEKAKAAAQNISAAQNPFYTGSAQPSGQEAANPFLPSASPAASDCSLEKTDSSRDACWQSRAISEKNPAFCDTIRNANPFVSKDACLNFVAQAKKDRLICSSIQNPDIRKNCENAI